MEFPTTTARPSGAGAFLCSVAHIPALLAAASLLIGHSFARPIGIFDEGFALTDALRLLHGDVPFRDYWTSYPPGTALTLASAFRLFTPSLAVARAVDAAWSLLLCLGIYALALRQQTRVVASGVALFASYWIASALYPSYAVLPALALAVLAVAEIALALEGGGIGQAVTAGLLGGAVVLFRHDFGFYFCLSAAIASAASALLGRSAIRGDRRCLAVFLATLALTSVVLLAVLLLWVGWRNFYDQAIVFPAVVVPLYRRLPVPGLFDILRIHYPHRWLWLLAWIGPMFVLSSGAIAFLAGDFADARRRFLLVFCGVMCALVLAQARSRLDLPHAAPCILMATSFVACVPLDAMGRRGVGALLLLNLACLLMLSSRLLGGQSVEQAVQCLAHHPDCLPPIADQMKAVEFVQSRTTADDPVFVGNTRHDIIYVNDASFYFLLQRRIPVLWNEMNPGVVTTEGVQRQMVRSLVDNIPPYVVLVDIPPSQEPNLSSVSSQVHILDDYVRRNYHEIASFGIYAILARDANYSAVGK